MLGRHEQKFSHSLICSVVLEIALYLFLFYSFIYSFIFCLKLHPNDCTLQPRAFTLNGLENMNYTKVTSKQEQKDYEVNLPEKHFSLRDVNIKLLMLASVQIYIGPLSPHRVRVPVRPLTVRYRFKQTSKWFVVSYAHRRITS